MNKELREKVINYLNEKTGKNFNPNEKKAVEFINGRINDKNNPATLEIFKHVIDIKCKQWLRDPENNKWLRPTTLFRPTNFESYRNEGLQKPSEKREPSEWAKQKHREQKEEGSI